MPITYTNRMGRTYYLGQSQTKTGKTRYQAFSNAGPRGGDPLGTVAQERAASAVV
jgi:hypothetical protein